MAEGEAKYEVSKESVKSPGYREVAVFIVGTAVRRLLIQKGSRFADKPKPCLSDEYN